jgi:hypothetical protein
MTIGPMVDLSTSGSRFAERAAAPKGSRSDGFTAWARDTRSPEAERLRGEATTTMTPA